MKSRIYCALAVAVAIVTTACSGGPARGIAAIPAVTAAAQNQAKTGVTFRIPLGHAATKAPAAHSGARPFFIDGSSDGYITMIFDGQTVMNAVSFVTNGTPGTAGPSGSATLPNGGSFNYTSQIVAGPNGSSQVYAKVNGTFTTYVGLHTLGVVQTNGACTPQGPSNPGQGPCLASNDGYVLAEGQQTFTLAPGSNPAIGLYLRGVMESAFVCDAGCDGSAGTTDSNGFYQLYVVAADENGTAIPYQTDANNSAVPFDNGSYKVVETDANNTLTISQPAASYYWPGTYRYGSYGLPISVKCNTTGKSATVAAELLPGDPSSGTVRGFTYSANNYPQSGAVLGPVGSNQYYAGPLTINC